MASLLDMWIFISVSITITLIHLNRSTAIMYMEFECEQRNGESMFELDFQYNNGSEKMKDVRNISISGTGLRHFLFEGLPLICVDLSRNKLNDWPLIHRPTETRLLNLSGNGILSWNFSRMSGFSRLEILDLSNNNLTKLNLNALQQLSSLQVIFLHGNPMHIFGELKHVRSLKAVVLSRANWYAVNNIDFGEHPVFLILNNSAEAAALRFRCSDKPNTTTYPDENRKCVDVADELQSSIIPRSACVSCRVCQRVSDSDKSSSIEMITSLFTNSISCNRRNWWILFVLCSLTLGVTIGLTLYAALRYRLRKELATGRAISFFSPKKKPKRPIPLSNGFGGCPYGIGETVINSPLMVMASKNSAVKMKMLSQYTRERPVTEETV